MFAALTPPLLRQMDEVRPIGAIRILNSLVHVGDPDPQLTSTLVARAMLRVTYLNMFQLSNLTWALSRARYLHRPTLNTLCDRFVEEATEKGGPPRPPDICRMLAATAELNHPHEGLLRLARERLTSASADVSHGLAEVARLTRGLAVLGGLRREEAQHVF